MKKLMDLREFFLRSCPYMKGMNEAWRINNVVLVSPAIFQLLTDEGDLNTLYTVASQLCMRKVSRKELRDLVEEKWNSISLDDNPNTIIYYQISHR